MRDLVFDVIQPGMKTSFAVDRFNQELPTAIRERGDSKKTRQELARQIVKEADSHFSGEHNKRSMLETNRFMAKLYFSPEARRFWQAALLSPTWQREHIVVSKRLGQSFLTEKFQKKLGMEDIRYTKRTYQKYALRAIGLIGAMDMYNYMATQQQDGEGKHLWQNPEGKKMSVRAWWDEPSYVLTDKNGKERTIKGGPGYIKPLKSIFEVAEWFDDPTKKVAHKLAPMFSWIMKQFPVGAGYGSRYKGYDLPKRSKDFIFDVWTPITVDMAEGWIRGQKSGMGTILPFFGMPVSKAKEDKKTKRQGNFLSRRKK